MRGLNRKLSLLLGFMVAGTSAFAWHDKGNNHGSNIPTTGSNRANCAPATDLQQLELNNVRALIENGGSMWQDRATGNASYEVPKDAGTMVIYSGALWMAGEDVNGQLKIAALDFRQGNDFWPGPLTTTGDAEITPDVCEEYDRFYQISRADVITFNAYYECLSAGLPDCDVSEEFPGYQVPDIITNWPAHGDLLANQAWNIAPFFDRDGDGLYNPDAGDYPDYDIRGEGCDPTDRTVRLYGDQTYWWILNDKGNVHTETGGDPIGMEIRAQAFAFATNDEVNNMTFYNYELINRSTQTLTNTYFGQWVDPDVGCSGDDYVGCDVQRGLGYAYNADATDDDNCNGANPYGANPPAVGVDFFEGPYKDNDGSDNPGPTSDNNFFVSYTDAVAGDGIVYKGMGIGYGDGVVDNERFGMRKFMIYTGGSTPGVYPFPQSDPDNAIEYYRYLQGLWQNGAPLVYGGGGYTSNPGANANVPCDYAYPGDSDPQGFGTGGVTGLGNWTEATAPNPKGDRRFIQSAGPFTLEPGAVNNITVGVVYARAAGGTFASVEAVRLADDKAQALFDNCFEIVEGPDAPDVTIQELDREVILYLSNTKGQSNNYVDEPEDYEIEDPFIITPDSLLLLGQEYDKKYRFEGYQIFQLKNEDVSASQLDDIDFARLVAQCDIKNGVGQLVNYTFNEQIEASEPAEMVNGSDEGIKHSFRFTEDLFAEGDSRLINHKKYFYMAIAYGYNNYKTYDPTDPTALDGQQKPYIASRKTGQGGEIQVYTAIPHIPTPEANGSVIQAEYGEGPEITRIEGEGNGGLILDITPATEATILASGIMADPTYQKSAGPVNVRVIDPLNVADGNYKLIFNRDKSQPFNWQSIEDGKWTLINLSTGDSVFADKTIEVANEQLIPEWGLSVEIEQPEYRAGGTDLVPEFLEATLEYGDSSLQWLSGVEDQDGLSDLNWIRSGTQENTLGEVVDANGCDDAFYNDYLTYDDEETYENVINGTWAPYGLVGGQRIGTGSYPCVLNMPVSNAGRTTIDQMKMEDLNSVDIVFTSDKSKWTRCPVIEMSDDPNLAEGGVTKMLLRGSASVDKQGRKAGDAGYNAAEGDLTSTTGMGWFPGYAIDLETGARLNMAFAEDSWLGVDNGRDMVWNPTSRMFSGLGQAVLGGKHYVYVFRDHSKVISTTMPAYDAGAYTMSKLATNNLNQVFRYCTWVGMPMLADGYSFDNPANIPTTARVRLRVSKKYDYYPTWGETADSTSLSENNWTPVYTFNTGNIATLTNVQDTACNALDLVNVVPNPYYAYSQYETNRLDNRVKFTNLPERCVISIFTSAGTLVRQFTKDDPMTSFDWDIKNSKGIPVASGTYIIHIKAEDLPEEANGCANERIIKWFGVTRPPDLDNF